MEFSLLDILYLVDQEAKREMWNEIGIAVAFFLALLLFCVAVRPAIRKIVGEIRRMRRLEALVLFSIVLPIIVYGSTKKTAVFGFDADECPDSVTFTWNEETSGLVVQAVQIERRVKGAVEEEAWVRWGGCVPGGRKSVTIQGFTLDRDYEYRARCVYTEGVQ